MAEAARIRTPWHPWVVGAAVLSITLGGVRDFVLLLRSRYAGTAALISGIAQMVLIGISLATMDRWPALDVATIAFDAGIAVMYLALWAYCCGQRSCSVLA